jgi:hypothetical protein
VKMNWLANKICPKIKITRYRITLKLGLRVLNLAAFSFCSYSLIKILKRTTSQLTPLEKHVSEEVASLQISKNNTEIIKTLFSHCSCINFCSFAVLTKQVMVGCLRICLKLKW